MKLEKGMEIEIDIFGGITYTIQRIVCEYDVVWVYYKTYDNDMTSIKSGVSALTTFIEQLRIAGKENIKINGKPLTN